MRALFSFPCEAPYVAAVDLGIVEAGAIDARLEIVGNDQPRNAADEAKQANMRADPSGRVCVQVASKRC